MGFGGLLGALVRPMQGAQKDGVPGFLVGLGQGVVGVVANPVAGAFGAVSTVAESVDQNLRYWDQRPMGRRREPRTGRQCRLLRWVAQPKKVDI